MKTKSIVEFLIAAVAFAIAVVVPNELAAMVQHTQASDLLDVAPMLGMATVSLANIDGTSFQTPNPGGTRLLLIVNCKDISGIWPKQADIVSGEIATGPTMVATAKIATYAFPDGTFSMQDAQDGDPGFQSYKHVAGFMLAGFNKTLTAELQKHLNAGCLIIGEMNDGQYALAGATDNPLFLKAALNTGAKGADKRGYTLKAEQDGYMWGVLPLKSTIVSALVLLP